MTAASPEKSGDQGRENLLRTLADNVPALIAYYEPRNLRCVFANKRYAESNGWSVDSIIGKTLREAVRRGEFVLFYQPQLRVDDLRPVGIEALVRWRHPERGLTDPSEFIEFAETPVGQAERRQAVHLRCVCLASQERKNSSD